MWNLGDSFRGDDSIWDSRHLIVLVTKPFIRQSDKERVVVAAIMTYDGNTNYQEDSCVLTERDGHREIHHNSFVSYYNCRVVPISTLDELLRLGRIKKRDSFNPEVQRRLLAGLSNSSTAKNLYTLVAMEQLEQLDAENA